MKYHFLVAIFIASFTTTTAQIVEKEAYETFKCSKSPVQYIAISPRGDVMAIGLMEYAEIWDISKGKKLHTLKHETPGDVKSVNYIQFNENGEYVCTVDFKGKRQIWSVSSGEQDKDLGKYTEWMPDPAFVKDELGLKMANSDFERYYLQQSANHPNNKDIEAKSTKKGTVEFHNTGDGAIEQEIKFEDNKDRLHLYPVFFDPNGGLFATGTDQGEVHLYKLSSVSRY